MPAAPPPASPRERLLVVRLASGRYTLPLAAVSDLADCSRLRQVPGAPDCVLGLSAWRGGVVTVLDLERLLGAEYDPGARCLVHLAAPLDHLAFAVPAAPKGVSLFDAEAEAALGAGSTPSGGSTVPLDLDGLLAAAESAVAGASRAR